MLREISGAFLKNKPLNNRQICQKSGKYLGKNEWNIALSGEEKRSQLRPNPPTKRKSYPFSRIDLNLQP